jgi:hypothetical protein
MSFKYEETHLVAIEEVCNNILRVTNTIKESRKKRELLLVKDFKAEKIVIGNSEYYISAKQLLGFLDTSIYSDEHTLKLLMLSLITIEKQRKENTLEP